MGFMESVNRAIFNLTYNEKASQAYDEQNEKAAGAVEDIKKQIDGYRSTREKIIGAGESTDYFSSNSIARITEWENWLEKNGGLAAGDYTKKSTEMKTQWDGILNVNKVVKEMQRVPKFIDLFIEDKDVKLPAAQKKELESLKSDAEKYYSNIVKQTPAEIIEKRDEFNRRFEEIQKKIPENFEDLKEPYEDASGAPATLLAGIQEENFNRYQTQVEKKQVSEDQTSFSVSRLFARIFQYFGQWFGTFWPFFFGTIFAMIIANDAIGRPAPYRIFYALWMFILFQVSLIPSFPFLAFLYYAYRSIRAVNWGNLFSGEGPRMDYMKAPILFAFLPISVSKPGEQLSWYQYLYKYNVDAYDGLAKKKQMAYEIQAADLVGSVLDPSTYGLEETTFNQLVCDLKSATLGVKKGSFQDVIDSLKALV
ncbi:MAG: hypothetical protein EBU82_08400 [Flavobacteriia bacterium]|jgi:hypothetical protein|nr:hypothetical protein [Flavobacteriia bacterium]